MKFILFLVLSVCAHAQFFGGNAAKIRGKNVKGVLSCSNGDALSWVSANNQFECAAPGAVGSSVGVKKAGTLIGTRAAINLIEGTAMTLTVTDDPGNNEVDVTITPSYTAGGSGAISISSGVIDIDTAAVCLKSTTCAPTGSFDLSGSAATKSMKAGTSLPGTCAVGELFYKTDATAGQNVYGCTATNTWTVQGGGGGGLPTAEAGNTYYCPFMCAFQQTNAAVSTTTPHYVKLWLPHALTVNRVAFRSVSSLGAGQSMAVALYNTSGTKISSSDARVTNVSAGAWVFSFGATLTLGPGTVILGWASEVNADLATIDNCCQILNTALNAGSNQRFFTATGSTSGTGGTYTMPASISSFTASGDAIANFIFLYN